MSKTWYPVIDYEKCIECGNLCPSEAISYVGDQRQGNNNCCTCGGCC